MPIASGWLVAAGVYAALQLLMQAGRQSGEYKLGKAQLAMQTATTKSQAKATEMAFKQKKITSREMMSQVAAMQRRKLSTELEAKKYASSQERQVAEQAMTSQLIAALLPNLMGAGAQATRQAIPTPTVISLLGRR